MPLDEELDAVSPVTAGATADRDTTPAPAAHEASSFRRGDVVAVRSIREFGARGHAVGFVVACHVLVDTDDVSVVATVPGSDIRRRNGEGAGPNGRLVLPDAWDGTHGEHRWSGSTVVRVHRHGDPWSVWRWHDGENWVGTWYGNLEQPWRRTDIGFDTCDWTLDVVCSGTPGDPDWNVYYKDEDELAWLLDVGAVTEDEAGQARDAGERLTHIALDGGWPFDADWDAWTPDPAWPPAVLPGNWRELV
ncbi:DUF402 domain-containing protein [Humibacter albus]|uniref:DUF402 domain-containing protein n=1 Tax=Humibacter albus TaxID=427754 RepID=UPI0003B3E740|nr:DUF402 domain-containing protein [Humibacter albus]